MNSCKRQPRFSASTVNESPWSSSSRSGDEDQNPAGYVAHVTASPAEKHRVVIVGAGFGGLFAARFLKRAPVEVTLVDRTNHHLFQPLLYQVATGILPPGAIATPTRDVLRRQANARVEL